MNMTLRPPISAAIKRQVRQRCGFGCVLCGSPIFDYDHIVQFSESPQHDIENLTLLCPQHHREKSSLRLSVASVEEANRNPYNRRMSAATRPWSLDFFCTNEFTLSLGGMSVVSPPMKDASVTVPLYIDDRPIIFFRREEDRIYLFMSLYDSRNNLVLQIDENEVVLNSHQWDIEIEGQTLTIRSGARQLVLRMTVIPDSGVVIDRGDLFHNGIHLRILNERSVEIVNDHNTIGRAQYRSSGGCLLALGDPPPGLRFLIVQGIQHRFDFPARAKRSVYWGENVDLSKVASEHGGTGILEDVIFENCLLSGPALVFVGNGSEIDGLKVVGDDREIDDFLWVVQEGSRMKVGVIALVRCTIRSCSARGLGFVVPETDESMYRSAFGGL